jgi:hypothetical protein
MTLITLWRVTSMKMNTKVNCKWLVKSLSYEESLYRIWIFDDISLSNFQWNGVEIARSMTFPVKLLLCHIWDNRMNKNHSIRPDFNYTCCTLLFWFPFNTRKHFLKYTIFIALIQNTHTENKDSKIWHSLTER